MSALRAVNSESQLERFFQLMNTNLAEFRRKLGAK